MTSALRPQLRHPLVEDLDELALQLLSLGWVVRAQPPVDNDDGALLVSRVPFDVDVSTVHLRGHHQIQLQPPLGPAVLVDDVEDLHHRLNSPFLHTVRTATA